MNFILVFLVSIGASSLTFFSGFGLGTLLLPVFLTMLPVELAILATALVHFSNSIFKFIFLFRHVDRKTFFLFGTPAIVASFFGALLVKNLYTFGTLYSHTLFSTEEIEVSFLNFLVGSLILLFTLLELSKKMNTLIITDKFIVLGGLISGFFGGLSGHQGALRSLFLKNLNLSKEQLVASSTAISLGIDAIRIVVYLSSFHLIANLTEHKNLLLVAIFGAFIGVTVGNKLLKKINLLQLNAFISICLILFSLCLMFGLI
jgi:uncharacterized membrane protein YfcA